MKKYDKKVIIAVAPAARHGDEKAERIGDNTPLVSVMTPEEIANDVINCAKEGASVIHMHVRDENGHLTDDLTQFRRTLGLIKASCDVIIEGSTGGVSELNAEQRGGVLNVQEVELAALNMGSVNLGGAAFVNEPNDIALWASLIVEKGKLPILECFEPGMIQNVENLLDEGVLRNPVIYGIPMGFDGTQPAKVVNMQGMLNVMPRDAVWYYQQHGMKDLSMIAAAVAAGAQIVRVGFEDSIYYAPNCVARTNAELVSEAAKVIRAIGYQVATVDEAREIIGLRGVSA